MFLVVVVVGLLFAVDFGLTPPSRSAATAGGGVLMPLWLASALAHGGWRYALGVAAAVMAPTSPVSFG